MKTGSFSSAQLSGSFRFDSKFHFSRHNPFTQELVQGAWPTQTIAAKFGRENVWTGNIFGRIYTSSAAHGKPLLVPYDLFRYVPWSDKILSRNQVKQFDRLAIQRGWLFLVCSGRNLGPVTIADQFCERFVMSHDMVRIAVEPTQDLFYLAAFLSTRHGQAAIRTDMNGSVIDHTDANQVAAIRYPLVGEALRTQCAGLFQTAFEQREKARLLLEACHADYLAHFGLDKKPSKGVAAARRFTVKRSQVLDRFDAEVFAPAYASMRRSISHAGGLRLDDIAEIRKPFGRYKTNYVDEADHGIRMMSGRHISQYTPIALKAMSLTGMANPDQFVLTKGMTLLTADGRAEENLADCVMVTDERDGWGASGHVHRVIPRRGINPGLVYLACSCAPVQRQLKALATGSVVDALSVADVGSVTVPYDDSEELLAIGRRAEKAWALFAASSEAESSAVNALEEAFAKRAGASAAKQKS